MYHWDGVEPEVDVDAVMAEDDAMLDALKGESIQVALAEAADKGMDEVFISLERDYAGNICARVEAAAPVRFHDILVYRRWNPEVEFTEHHAIEMVHEYRSW